MNKIMTGNLFKRLFTLIALLFAGSQLYAQDLPVTIKLDNVPLTEVLKSIEAQTPYRFSYRNKMLDKIENISLNCEGAKVKNLLDSLLHPRELEYKMTSGKIISIIKGKPMPQPTVVVIGADVMDDVIESPLPDAKVELLAADSTKIEDLKIVKLTTFALGERVVATQVFSNQNSGKKYILHGSKEGYEDAWVDIDIPLEKKDMVWKKLRLRKSMKKSLDEVVVTATKVKMFWKGDTIVYDASAFNLPEGSMLDDLIRQMPGVTMNENGEIFVNGRKVDELLLGSHSFFRGDKEVLLKNLPYYTVKNVKVYEKSSDLSEALGYDVESKRYVMDVNLLEKYKRGIIANIEGAAGTSSRYLGRAFMLGYTDILRVSVVGNANNVNEKRHIGENGNWTPEKMPKSMLTTRSIASDIRFDNKKVSNLLNMDYTSASDKMEMTQRRETFLNGASPLTIDQTNRNDKNHKILIKNYFHLKNPWVIVNLEYTHRKFSSRFASKTEQFDKILTNSLSDFGFGDGRADLLYTYFYNLISLNKDKRESIGYYIWFNNEMEKSRNSRQYDFILPPGSPLRNINNFYNRQTSSILLATYRRLIRNRVQFILEPSAKLKRTKKYDYLYHPDTLILPSQRDALLAITDFSNSYDSRYHIETFDGKIIFCKGGIIMPDETMPYPFDYRIWEANISVSSRHHSLYYHRGMIDTNITCNHLTLNPGFSLNLYPTGKYSKQISLTATHTVNDPSLYDRIDYRDDSQPLIVKLGNPDLKADQSTKLTADFYSRGSHQKMLHAGANFDYLHRATAQSVEYSPLTGVYTYRPVNVSGNWNLSLKVNFNRSLDKQRDWTISNIADGNFNHSLDHSMMEGETQSHLNKVNTLTLHDEMYIQFAKGPINLRASGDVKWRHSTGKMRDFTTLNAVDFQYGLSARYTLPLLKTTIAADGTMYSRRGYGSSALNTNDFILNASISQPMLKGKLVASIESFDLLHQMSQTQYEVNAQGRVETWIRSLPHYVMFHLKYNFSISPAIK